jgi:alkyl sulfatase BDS1-like metallo-beta-lactamase superfamily hydrolase
MTEEIYPSFDDRSDFNNADRGFIAALVPCIVRNGDGRVVWNNDEYGFLGTSECSNTANPSLWRQAQLVSKQGLYKVTDSIYQVRGLDLSNMTLVESKHGVIVIDPLISVECAEAALLLYRKHRGERKVTGLIYTHCHADHFGGAGGVISASDKDVPIIAPEGFLEHAVSENVYCGNAMTRRAVYMYGDRLPKAPDGQIGAGLGMTTSTGMTSLIPPNVHVSRTGQEEMVDGVRIVFQITPGTEAPAEMNFHFPQYRALCMAENATHNLHNILTLRGAVVRDARVWSRYLSEAVVLFSEESDVAFASHHWPTWGQKHIITFLSEQRDLYAYLHDQTLRMINQGLTGLEIAEDFVLPLKLQQRWHARGYYGSISHNVKAIYQRYMGWFDGNPAHLWEHPPVQAAKRYVECIGGLDSVILKAKSYAQQGDLRFACTLLNHAVFAEPSSSNAREALASVYDRLAFGSENGPWRNFYLTGAQELRHGENKALVTLSGAESMQVLSAEQLFDSIAIMIDGLRAQNECYSIDIYLKDLQQQFRLILSNGALTYYSVAIAKESPNAAGFKAVLTKKQLVGLLSQTMTLADIEQEGDASLLAKLLSFLVMPERAFPIVTP